MKIEQQIKFLERIIPISRFYTTSYISEKTSKLIWAFFVLNSIYILLFTKTITIKELTIYVFSIEIDPNQLMILITIAALAILIKVLMNVRGDFKNNRYDFELNTCKFKKLNEEISCTQALLMDETTFHFKTMNVRIDKLNKAFEKALKEKNRFDIPHSLSYQDKDIRAFCNAKFDFISFTLKRAHTQNDAIMQEIRNQTRILSSNIESLGVVVKSYKKQWWVTTLTNFIPPVLTIIYTFYMHFSSDIINIINIMKLAVIN